MSGKNCFNFDVNPGNIIPSDFGNTTRDNFLKFQLENEVGATLGYVKDGNFAKISLISKTGKTLNTIRFKVGSGEAGPALISVTLDETNKRLVFSFIDESVLYCDLTPLYNTLNNKVDKIEGKGLSTNDLTNELKSKIQTAVQPSAISDMATKTWVEGKGYLTEHQSLAEYRKSAAQDDIDDEIKADIATINSKISPAASSTNPLTDKEYVDEAISTSSATFRGTSPKGLTEVQFLNWANNLPVKDKNDYVFWDTVDETGKNRVYKQYKYDGTQWLYEFTRSDISFTSTQWDAINSGINSTMVTKLDGIETGAQVNTVNSVNDKTGTVVLKTSDLENDSHYVNETQLATKQDKLTAGKDITIENNVINSTAKTYRPLKDEWKIASIPGSLTLREFCEHINDDPTVSVGDAYGGNIGSDKFFEGMYFEDPEDPLTSGEVNVQILGDWGTGFVQLLTVTSSNHAPYMWQYTWVDGLANWVSWTDVRKLNSSSTSDELKYISLNGTEYKIPGEKYTAGNNISIDSSNKISAVDTKYTAGQNITISSDNVISATNPLPEGTEDTQALIFNGTEWIKQAGYGYQKCDYTEIYWNGTTTGKTVVEVSDFGTVICKVDNNQYLPSKSELLGNKFNYKDSEGTQEDTWTEDNLVSTEDYIISNTSPAYTLIIVYSASAEVSYYGQGITLTKGIWYSKQNDFTYFSNLKYGPINVKINSDFIPSDETKVDKIDGKGLSTKDYTAADQSKLTGIEPGAQVNKIEHIKVNGIEQTIVDKTVDLTITEEVLDTNVKLSSQLKTYYNIGKVQTASGTNPVVIGEAGDTLRKVLNNLTQMDEIQPTITAQPSISNLTFSSTASDEIGTVINQVSYSLSTNEGSYTYGPKPTGVTWSSFKFSGGCATVSKSTKTGTLALSTPFVVGTSSSVSFNCEGTHSEGNIAKTNLGNNSDPIVKISSGTKNKTSSFSKSSTIYAYTCVTNSSTAPITGCTKQTSVSTFEDNGGKFSYEIGDYIYFYTEGTGKTVQTNVLGQWADVATTYIGKVTITQSNGAEHTFDCYRIGAFIQSGSDDIFRI